MPRRSKNNSTPRVSNRQYSSAVHFMTSNRVAAEAAAAATGLPLGKVTFKCDKCPKEYLYFSGLKRHKRTHTKRNLKRCSYCPREFTEKSHLDYHIKSVHTNQKPFSCTVCGKEFTDKPHLKRHELIHLTRKPFKCEKCSNTFAQSGQLVQHRIAHGH